jgi:hypothetical protein
MTPHSQSRAIAAVFFVLGFGTMLSISMFRENQLTKAHAAAMTESAVRMKELVNLRENDLVNLRACQEVERADEASQGIKTVLIDRQHPYGPYAPFGFYARGGTAGPAWVISRHVIPQVMDGVLSGAYAYIGEDGKMTQWYTAGRAEGMQ